MLERSSAKKRKDRMLSLGEKHPMMARRGNIFEDDTSPIESPLDDSMGIR
jgi:hypothetical protein